MHKPLRRRAWLRGWLVLLDHHAALEHLGWPARSRLRWRVLLRLFREPVFRVQLLCLGLLALLARSLAWHLDLAGAGRDLLLVSAFVLVAPGILLRQHLRLLQQLREIRAPVVVAPTQCSNSADENSVQADLRAGGSRHCPAAGRHHPGSAVR